MKRFLTFDPLNLPSSRRLVERSSNQGCQEQDDGTTSQSPELDMTGHSASRHDDYDSDHDSCNGDASDDTWGVGLRNRRRSSTSVQAPSQLHRSKEEVEGTGTQFHRGKVEVEGAGTQFQVRTKLGQTVHWTTQYHYSTEELEPYRQVGDVEMDQLLDLCASEGLEGAGRFDDIVRVSAEAAETLSSQDQSASASPARQALADFHRRYSSPPTFVDWDQLQRGIDIFVTYAPAAGTSLYYRSLVGGFSIPKITQVLFATKYLAPPSPPEKVKERLMDTGGFLAACFAPVSGANTLPAAAIRPGGQGWEAALRVRHLHARVRRSIINSKTLDWDTTEFGIPINQEDMGATVLAFSVNLLVGIEFIGGRALSEEDQNDYLALWRYLSWLLGVEISFDDTVTKNHLPPLDPCGGKKAGEPARAEPDPIAHSYSLLESIIFHLLNPTDISKKVASHLLDIGRNSKEERRRGVVKKSSADKYAEEDAARHRTFGFQYRAFMCRRNLGEPLANALDLPCPPKFSFTYGILLGLSSMHLMLMRVYTLATMHIPFLRTRINKWHANGMAKFFGVWEREHNKRMRRANTEDNDGDAKAKEGSSCPFALIMQPE